MSHDPIFPPINFAQVDYDIYRSALPTSVNFPFLLSLRLRTVVLLSEECPEAFIEFIDRCGINLVVVQNVNAHTHAKWSPVAEEMVTRSLDVVLKKENLPVLICCKLGKSFTGVVIGCLRKLQRWSLISIVEEYRRFAGSRQQQQHEQFIELFDTDLVAHHLIFQMEPHRETQKFVSFDENIRKDVKDMT